MPICCYPACTHGAGGKRYSGAALDVHAHEVAVHGKPLSGRSPGKAIVIVKSPFWAGVYGRAKK